MIGLVEVGNSVIKFRVDSDDRLQSVLCHTGDWQTIDHDMTQGHVPYLALPEYDLLASDSRALMQRLRMSLADLAEAEQIWFASVASAELNQVLRELFAQVSTAPVIEIQTQARQYGIDVCYQNPNLFGVDRWLNLIAAKRQFNSAAIVIDAGSAVTIDVIDSTGKHLGGFITPGLQLQRRALLANTNFEFNVNKEVDEVWSLACDSESAVHRGTLYSIVSWIDKVITRIHSQYTDNFVWVITGGDAPSLLPLLEVEQQQYQLETHLTFLGMLTVAKSEL